MPVLYVYGISDNRQCGYGHMSQISSNDNDELIIISMLGNVRREE